MINPNKNAAMNDKLVQMDIHLLPEDTSLPTYNTYIDVLA